MTKNGAPAQRGETYAGQSREQRETDRRERIVAAAVQLFAERDYDDVTVVDVCARARISKRYFYEHFLDREDLLLAVHRELNDQVLSVIADAVPRQPADLHQVLSTAMTALVGHLRDNPERARVIYINAPRMELRRRGIMHKDAEAFSRLVRRVIKPRDRVLFDRVLLALAAGVTEVIIDWISNGMTGDPTVLVEHLTRLGLGVLSGLA